MAEENSQVPENLAESVHRTAIGRVYYGLLHWLKANLGIKVQSSKVGTYHSFLISRFEEILDDEDLTDFHFLMKARVDADNDLTSKIPFKLLEACLSSSERVLARIRDGKFFPYDADDDSDFYDKYRG